MIIDHIKNVALYNNLTPRIRKALNYLQTTDFSTLSPGKYEIDGDHIFAMVNEYETRPLASAELEAHRTYLDIQYVHHGTEQIGYAPLLDQQPSGEFNTAQDCGFYQGTPSLLNFTEKMFAIFYPGDLHMPGIGETASFVKKVVVKVRV